MRDDIFVSKWMGLYPGGLKIGGGLKSGFYGTYFIEEEISEIYTLTLKVHVNNKVKEM